MPVIEIKALPQQPKKDVQAVLRKITSAVAEEMKLPPRRIWALWQDLEPHHYVEGDVAVGTQPQATHPPIVTLKMFQGRPPELIERVLQLIGDTLSEALHLEPGNVFLTYHEIEPGRLYTGGQVVHERK